jgi:hypothetical protein
MSTGQRELINKLAKGKWLAAVGWKANDPNQRG